MKQNIILKIAFAGLVAFSATSCNYLDFDETTGTEKEYLYQYMDTAEAMLNAAYLKVYSDFGNVGSATLDCATDDAIWYQNDSSIKVFGDGSWSPVNTVDDRWYTSYNSIRALNGFIADFDKDDFSEFQYNYDYDTYMAKFEHLIAEARVLRAMFFFDLAKRYGDIPLPLKVLSGSEANSIKRTPLSEVVEFIIKECTECAATLPEVGLNNDTGRVTKGMALALKSRVSLFWASPLCNPDDINDRWVEAAKAAKEVMDMNVYELQKYSEADNLNNVKSSKELIYAYQNYTGLVWEQRNSAIGIEGGSTGMCPTQNLVNAFQTVDGYDVILDENGYQSDDPKFNSANPYNNRDPRFYRTVLYNGASWKANKQTYTIQTYAGGNNGAPKQGATLTGYYTKKYMIEDLQLTGSQASQPRHFWVVFRYAEMVLNYAEAMNEAYGAEGTDAGNGLDMTALAAVNSVRQRAGVADLKAPASDDKFREAIHNERRVEFALEGMRFWDLRRWRTADAATSILGTTITKSGSTYNHAIKSVASRVWSDKMYWYPIPQNEIYKNNSLTQNKDW